MGQSQFQAADLVGTVVDDRFEILSRLGEGGMGAVYKARQISMDRMVALKILLHDQRGDPISVERFRHEAYLASRTGIALPQVCARLGELLGGWRRGAEPNDDVSVFAIERAGAGPEDGGVCAAAPS